MSHRARLTAWYEQLVQRSQPFIGWQPLTTAEMEADDNQSSFGSTRAEEPISRSESPMISKELPPFTRPVSVAQDQPSAAHLDRFSGEQQRPPEPSILRRSISGPIHTAAKSTASKRTAAGDLSSPHEPARETTGQPMTPIAQRGDRRQPRRADSLSRSQATPCEGRTLSQPNLGARSSLAAPTQRREEQSLERPALRLAILRPINTAAGTVQRKESGPLSSAASGFSMAETNDLRPEHSLVEGLSAFQPRLVSRASSLPRQEVRGGFPAHHDSRSSR